MSLNSYYVSAGLFIRGLNNLKIELRKAEEHVATGGSGEAALLEVQLATDGRVPGVSYAPTDLHVYTLAARVHWAAERAKLAISHLHGVRLVPASNDAKSFANLHQRLG